VQNPTQALQSVKGPANTFDWSLKCARTLPSLIYFYGIFTENTPPSIICFSNIKVDIWHPAVGLRCGNPPRHLNQLKTRAIPLIETPSGQELCHSRYIFHLIFIKNPLHKTKFKYQSWYLTSCCGLEVQKPTQAPKSVKGPDNTFDLIPKWVRILPSVIYFSWDINRDPHPSP
jgi:hypothetical protein